MNTDANSSVQPQELVPSLPVGDAAAEVLSPEDFKLAFRGLAAGVAVITASVDGERAAMTATSVASISAAPPLFIFSASQLSSATDIIARADTIVVHILASAQLEIARLCATSGIDRFGDTTIWSELPSGEPHFHGAAVWIRGRVLNRFIAGSSVVHVVEALSSNADSTSDSIWSPDDPLVYHNRTWHALGDHSSID